jgi:SSS family transporter
MLIAFVSLYLLANIGIGVVVSRRIHNSNDFLTAGRQLPLALSSFALFALWYGSETIFGASSVFMEEGLFGVIEDPFGAALCLLLFATFFARRLYRMNIWTLGDLFRQKFGKTTELMASVFMILSFFGYAAAQLVALAILFQVLAGVSMITGILISALVVGIYTVIGGMWAISVADFFQSIVIILGLSWVVYVLLDDVGGLAPLMEQAPEGFFRFTPKTHTPVSWSNYFAAWATLGLGSLASQDIFQRFNAAKSEKTSVLSGYIGAGLYLVFAMFPLIIGLIIRIAYPEYMENDTQLSIPTLIKNHTTLPVQVLLMGALMSAIFSTCSGAILAPASLLAENIIKPRIRREISGREMLRYTRLSVIFIVLISSFLAVSRQDIYELVGESSVLGLVSILVPMCFALFTNKVSSLAAIFSMITGFIVWFLAAYIVGTAFPPLILGGLGSLAAYFAGFYIKRKLR